MQPDSQAKIAHSPHFTAGHQHIQHNDPTLVGQNAHIPPHSGASFSPCGASFPPTCHFQVSFPRAAWLRLLFFQHLALNFLLFFPWMVYRFELPLLLVLPFCLNPESRGCGQQPDTFKVRIQTWCYPHMQVSHPHGFP